MMRLLRFVPPLLLAIIVSCEGRNPVEKYGDDVTKAYKETEQFGKEMNIKSLQDAIRSFRVMHDRYPRDLGELEHFTGKPLDADRYDYDPSAGTVKGRG